MLKSPTLPLLAVLFLNSCGYTPPISAERIEVRIDAPVRIEKNRALMNVAITNREDKAICFERFDESRILDYYNPEKERFFGDRDEPGIGYIPSPGTVTSIEPGETYVLSGFTDDISDTVDFTEDGLLPYARGQTIVAASVFKFFPCSSSNELDRGFNTVTVFAQSPPFAFN
jgi:hypothetical protein